MKNYVSNDMIIAILSVTVLLLVIAIFVVLMFFLQQRRKIAQKNKIEELNQKAMQLEIKFKNELLQTQLEIQEQTLKTISQEIHDNIGQALTLAKLNLNTIQPMGDQQLQQKILNSKELVGKAIGDLRDLSHSLDTDYVQEMGFQRAVEYELERIQKSGVINTVMEVQGNIYRLSKQKELILFRIIQEAFNNILKHAEAKTIKVLMSYLPVALELTITDDGKGIDLTRFSENLSGLGTRNMQSRAQLIGAAFTFDSLPGNGTSINIFLPVESNTHEARQ